MEAYEVIASDLDGTLLSEQHTISQLTRRTIKTIMTGVCPGTKLVLVSGRSYFDVKRLCDQLILYVNADDITTDNGTLIASPHISPSAAKPPANALRYTDFYVISSNGAVVKDAVTEQVLYEKCIDPTIAEELFTLLPATETVVNTNAYQHDDWIARLDWPEMEQMHKESGLQYVLCPQPPPRSQPVEDAARCQHGTLKLGAGKASGYRNSHLPCIPEGSYDGISKIYYLGPPAVLAALRTRIETRFGRDTLSLTNSGLQCLDVMAAGVNKGAAIEQLLKRITPSSSKEVAALMQRTIAFGDGLNDAEMLSVVGKGCVMHNCNPALLERCPNNEVVQSCGEDGVARKLCEVFNITP